MTSPSLSKVWCNTYHTPFPQKNHLKQPNYIQLLACCKYCKIRVISEIKNTRSIFTPGVALLIGRGELSDDHIGSLRSSLAFHNIKRYRLSFFQRFKPFSLNGRVMHEYIVSAIHFDKSVTLL